MCKNIRSLRVSYHVYKNILYNMYKNFSSPGVLYHVHVYKNIRSPGVLYHIYENIISPGILFHTYKNIMAILH